MPATGIIILVASIVAVVLLVAVALVVWGVSMYNGLVRLRNVVDEGWATIDVQLKKRYDLIPNLVETVKGYAKHEQTTLEAVIEARNSAMSATGEGKMAAENALSGTLKSLFALSEAYPELKANAGFLDLQQQLKGVESELSAARRYYNGTVKEFNTKIESFPSNIIAKMMHLEKRKYFELENEAERQNVKVEF